MSVLEIRGLTTAFQTARGEIAAIEEVDLDLAEGEILGIVGESGSGKSVTALTAMGLLPRPPARIVAGSVRFAGQELTTLPEAAMRRIRGPGMGMIFQEPMTSLNPVLTVGVQVAENVVRHTGAGWREAMDRAVEMLRLVRVPDPEQIGRAHV